MQVSYIDGQGTVEFISSAATEMVRNANEPVSGNVSIIGTATEDQVLTADTVASLTTMVWVNLATNGCVMVRPLTVQTPAHISLVTPMSEGQSVYA